MIRTLAVESYRSLRQLVLPLSPLTVVTGANGAGKSSLYRALRLLADAARNGAVAALAREGGLASTLWAGPEGKVRKGRPVQGTVRTKPVALRLGFGGDEYGYALDLGMPVPAETMFGLDPEFKREALWTGPVLRPAGLLAERTRNVVRARDDSGAWGAPGKIGLTDSMLSELADAVADAFPGSRVEVTSIEGRFGLRFHQHGLLRPLDAAELSDGTLRYLLWVAALLTQRPPELLVLNEPETSLHPDLLPSLANLISTAATRSQVVVVTHATRLVEALSKATVLTLVKSDSTTTLDGQGLLDQPPWHWPER